MTDGRIIAVKLGGYLYKIPVKSYIPSPVGAREHDSHHQAQP